MLMRSLVILKNVKSMTNMVKMHSRKEWVGVVTCMTHLTFSHPSLVVAHLEVRHPKLYLLRHLKLPLISVFECLY